MWSRLAGLNSARSVALDEGRYPLVRLLEAAHAVGDDSAAGRQRQWLSDPDDGIRYWAAVGLRARSNLTEADRGALRTALQDSSPTVRIEAAAALAAAGESDVALPVLRAGLQDRSTVVALHAARALELLGDLARPLRPDLLKALATAGAQEKAGDDYAMFIRFALESALEAPPR
jgi:HEAT repeat protein